MDTNSLRWFWICSIVLIFRLLRCTNCQDPAIRSRYDEGSSKLIITDQYKGLKFSAVKDFWIKEFNPVQVHYLQSDITKDNAFLVSYDLGLGVIDVNRDDFTNLCGNDRGNTPGYKEGIGASAKFAGIRSFSQHNQTTVIVVDGLNHCIRSVDRESHKSQALAGKCEHLSFTSQAIKDGSLLSAVFNNPHDIAQSLEDPNEYYILDTQGRALRRMSLTQRTVTTIYQGPKDSPTTFRTPVAMSIQGDFVYVGVSGGIVKVDVKTGELQNETIGPVGLADGLLTESKFQKLKSLQFLTDTMLIALEDWRINREDFIRMIDIKGREVKSLNITQTPSENSEVSMHVIKCLYHSPEEKRIYVGGTRGISVVEYENAVNGVASVNAFYITSLVGIIVSIMLL